MNKKIIITFIVIILLSSLVNADPFSTIATTGLSFINPTAGAIINGIMCVTSPAGLITCASNYVEGRITGIIQGEVLGRVVQSGIIGQQAVKSINTYNQFKGYLDQGASIIQELTLDENGAIESGEVYNIAKDGDDIGNLFGLNKKDAYGKDINILAGKNNLGNKEYLISFSGDDSAFSVTNKDGVIFDYINIKKQDKNTNAYLKLNKEGNVIGADFTTNENGGVYKFGDNKPVNVPGDTRVTHQNGVTRVEGKGKTIRYFNNDILLNSEFVDFSLNKISCGDCNINEVKIVNGELEILDNGYLTKYGVFEYRGLFLKVGNPQDNVLIANENADLSNYNGNWLRQKPDSLEIKSSITSNVNLDVLGSNSILSPIGDNKDYLSLNVQKGGEIKLESRKNRGLIPILIYTNNGNSAVIITNNGYKIEKYKDAEILTSPNALYKLDYTGKYQSVALDIANSKDPSKILRFNSYNQFVTLNKNNEELVTVNKFDLPLSPRINDNRIQTIAHLQAKYPKLKFSIPSRTNIFGEDLNRLYEEEVPPYLIYLTDTFFERNPKAVNDFEGVEFTDEFNAHVAADGVLMIGEQVVDPFGPQVRDTTKPLQVYDHEYTHRLDQIIANQEFDIIKNDENAPEVVKNNLKEKERLLKEIEILEHEFDDEMHLAEKIELDDRIKDLKKKISGLDDAIRAYWYEDNEEEALLVQKYNEIALEFINNVLDDKNALIIFADKISNTITKEELPYFKDYIKREYKKDLDSYLIDSGYRGGLSNLDGEAFEELLLEELIAKYEIFRNNPDKKIDFDRLNEIQTRLANVKYFKNKVKNGEPNFYALYEFDELSRRHSNLFRDYLRISAGVPYIYSFRNYARINDIPNAKFAELASTYKEQPIEIRKYYASSFNIVAREVTRKLTQLAFDSNKMDSLEYKEVMGLRCSTPDCMEFKCLEYKLLCCQQYPNSPNCKS